MKLKTLKDIEPFNNLNPTFINRGILQREAIKWWKAIKNNDVENKDCQGFIKLFFNITKEDLK